MPYSFQDFTLAAPVAAGATSVHSCTLEALDASHLSVYVRPSGEETGSNQVATITGSSGAFTVTVTMAEAQAAGALVRVVRTTPITEAGRLVVFANGRGLDYEALNTALTQVLYIAQELSDKLARAPLAPIIFPDGLLTVNPGDGQPVLMPQDQPVRRMSSIGIPETAGDAARLEDVVVEQTAQGNLPSPTLLSDNTFLLAISAQWVTRTLAQVQSILGLGTAASANTGTGAANVPTITQADARYLRIANALSELSGVAATARSNLGLGTAATKSFGTGANQLVELDASARLPAVDGRNLTLTNHLVYGRNGGDIGCAGAVSVTVSTPLYATASGTWATDALTLLPLDALSESVGNGSSDIAVNTGTDRLTLKAGKWKIRVEAAIKNVSTGTTYAFSLALYDITAGTHNESLVPVADPANGLRVQSTSGTKLSITQFTKSFIKTLAVDTTFEIHGAADSGAGTNLQVFNLKLIAEKVND